MNWFDEFVDKNGRFPVDEDFWKTPTYKKRKKNAQKISRETKNGWKSNR